GLTVLNQDLADEYPPSHCQVQIMTHRLEMRQRRAHAHAVDVVRGCHAQASRVLSIRIFRRAEPRLPTSIIEGLLDGRPGPCLTAPDGYRAIRAMEIILNIEIVLGFTEVRQDLVIRPFIVAERRPGIKILGETPLHGLPVDGRSTPNDLALRHVDFP